MKTPDTGFAICLSNAGYEVSLIVRKVYIVVADEAARQRGMLRVVDESDEDYLFPERMFLLIDLPADARKLLHDAA